MKVVEGRKLEVTRISQGGSAAFSKVSADQSHPITEKLEKPVIPKVEQNYTMGKIKVNKVEKELKSNLLSAYTE